MKYEKSFEEYVDNLDTTEDLIDIYNSVDETLEEIQTEIANCKVEESVILAIDEKCNDLTEYISKLIPESNDKMTGFDSRDFTDRIELQYGIDTNTISIILRELAMELEK